MGANLPCDTEPLTLGDGLDTDIGDIFTCINELHRSEATRLDFRTPPGVNVFASELMVALVMGTTAGHR